MSDEEDAIGYWFALHAQILEDEKVEILIENHGHEAFTMVIGLLCQAQLQRQAGVVEFTFRSFAHLTHTSVEQVREIVPAIAEVDFIEIRERKDRGMTIFIQEWKKWQDRFRQAKSRAKKAAMSQSGHNEVTEPSLNQAKPNQTEPSQNESSGSSPADAPLSHLLADLIAENTGKRPRIGKRWFDAERLLFSADGRDREQADRLLRWTQQDDFWRGNILSMAKFRKQYDQLLLHARREPDFESTPIPRPMVEVEESPEAVEAWEAAQPVLKQRLYETAWCQWIQPLRVLGRSGSRIVLGAPPAILTWVERRYLDVLVGAIEGFDGFEFVEVEA